MVIDSSFDITDDDDQQSSTFHNGQRHHTTPITSRSSTPFSSRYNPRRTRRLRHQIPSTPFSATHDDSQWQSEISWQFEPTGWNHDSNLGAALSPWTAAPSYSPLDRSHVFQRSANDYYNSGRSNNRRAQSGGGRLQLQSYVARDHQHEVSSIFSTSSIKPSKGVSGLQVIKEITTKKPSGVPLADKDELSTREYDTSDEDVEGQIKRPNNDDHHTVRDSRWYSVSHAYMENDDDHHHSKGQHFEDHNADGFLSEDEEDEDDDLDDVDYIEKKPIGLFGLFKYSSKFDMLLVFLGCIGALINGGSLPWYSYLFGNFVNKITADGTDNVQKMMKDVQEVL